MECSYAFISYSSKNQAAADSVRRIFRERGIATWMAPYDIPSGSKYAAEITKALKNCSCLVLLLSNASQSSEHVDREVERAVNYRKPIVPVQIEDLLLNDSFEYYIGNCHIIAVPELRINSKEFERVIDGVRAFVSETGPISDQEAYERAIAYLKNNDFEEAAKWCRNAADQGHAEAQTLLGFLYQNGAGVVEDKAEAARWYRKAADQGWADAQYRLGVSYVHGEGVIENKAEAVKWFCKAADQGFAAAQHCLGLCYHLGEGVTKNYAKAVKWYRKAADQGYVAAQNNLGVCYEDGEGVTKNKAQAIKWYRKAADQGDEKAKEALKRLL